MLVTWAGLQKESQSAKRDDTSVGHDVRYAKAQHNCVVWVLMAVLAGILSAGLNFSFAFGQASLPLHRRQEPLEPLVHTRFGHWRCLVGRGRIARCSIWVRLFSMASERSDSVCWEHQWDGQIMQIVVGNLNGFLRRVEAGRS
jgi:hypothetical protein